MKIKHTHEAMFSISEVFDVLNERHNVPINGERWIRDEFGGALRVTHGTHFIVKWTEEEDAPEETGG